HISFLKPCLLGRRAFLYLKDPGWIIANDAGNDHGKDKGQNKVEDRPCSHHGNPCPDRCPVKRPLAVVIVILSYHHAGASNRKELQRVSGLPLYRRKESWPHTQRKFCNCNTVSLSQ